MKKSEQYWSVTCGRNHSDGGEMKRIEIEWDTTLTLEVESQWHKGSRGARERGSGIPLEPDEPAGYEMGRIYVRGAGKLIDITDYFSADEYGRINEELDSMGDE